MSIYDRVSEYPIAFQYLRILQSKNPHDKGRRLYKDKKWLCTLSHLLSVLSRKETAGIKEDKEALYRTDYQAPRAFEAGLDSR